MIVGDPSIFAIESSFTCAYERLSFRALGYFVIHVGSHRYGVCKPDASMLASPFEGVGSRLDGRGNHTAPFASEDAGQIAEGFRNAIYADEQAKSYFGLPLDEFSELFYERSSALLWAPGDEAFDDGSYVLQFDVGESVRLIAFRCGDGHFNYEPCTLRDVWLASDEYYDVLQKWSAAFEREWNATPKTPELM